MWRDFCVAFGQIWEGYKKHAARLLRIDPVAWEQATRESAGKREAREDEVSRRTS
jgi:hypothetical protein